MMLYAFAISVKRLTTFYHPERRILSIFLRASSLGPGCLPVNLRPELN